MLKILGGILVLLGGLGVVISQVAVPVSIIAWLISVLGIIDPVSFGWTLAFATSWVGCICVAGLGALMIKEL